MAIDYLTRQEIEDYYRERQLPLDNNDNTNEAKITQCINLVRREIELYLREGGYKAPLTEQEEVDQLKHLSFPIFEFYLNEDSGNRTRETITNYDYSRSILKKIANNDISIDIPKVSPDEDELITVKLGIY